MLWRESSWLRVAGTVVLVLLSALVARADDAGAPIRIGVSLGLSGSYESITRHQERAYQLWVRQVNDRGGILGRKVELVIRDDKSDPEVAKTIYESFIEKDKVDFVFGPYSSHITSAIAPIVDRKGYPTIAAGASADDIWRHGYQNVFGLYAPASRYAIGFLAVLAEAGVTRVAIVSVDDVFSLDVAEGARKWAPQYGLQITNFVVQPKAKPDMARAAQEARASNAQALFLAGHYNEAIAMRDALKQLGWTPRAYYAAVGPALPKYYERLGRDANGTFSTSLWEAREDLRYPGSTTFLRAFVAAYGEAPSYQGATAYAAGQVLEQAIIKAGSIDHEAVRRALFALDVDSIVGRYAVDRTGAQIKQFALTVQWQGSRREIVWPPELKTAAPMMNK